MKKVMELIELEMILEKETTGTYRYKAMLVGVPPAVSTLYIAKWALGDHPPERVKVKISEE